jgi:hypothetical protein
MMKNNQNSENQLTDNQIQKMKGNIMNNTASIIKRVVNSKRHTVGFVLSGNRRVTRSEAVRMARSSRIRGVRVVSGSQGTYLQSTTDRNLYDLPTVNA